MIRLLLGFFLFWAILRIFRAIVKVLVPPKKRSAEPGVRRGPGKDENPSLKADGVIDVDYTETKQSEPSKEEQ